MAIKPLGKLSDWSCFKGIYCRLYCYAQKHVKNIRAVTRPIDLPAGLDTKKSLKQKNKALHIHMHNHHSSPYHVSDHKAAVTVGIIMGVFLICWVGSVSVRFLMLLHDLVSLPTFFV